MAGIISYAITGVIPLFLSFYLSFYLIKKWIPLAKSMGYLVKDMNKYGYPKILVEHGGIFVIISISFSIFTYLLLKTYLLHSTTHILESYTISTILILAALIGVFDDILGWKKGLKPWQRPLLTFLIAIPLVIFKYGNTKLTLPIIGTIDFGLLYPLLLVPIGVMGASNAFNMIAGYNGLEALMGIALFLGLLIKFLLTNQIYLAFISLLSIFAILGFYIYNKYPAKVVPGNVFTYGIGALFATLVILGNIERFGLSIFVLYFLEFILFIRGLLNGIYKENFGIPDENNCLKPPYDKAYSVTHLALKLLSKFKKCVREPDVTYSIFAIQLLIVVIAIILGL